MQIIQHHYHSNQFHKIIIIVSNRFPSSTKKVQLCGYHLQFLLQNHLCAAIVTLPISAQQVPFPGQTSQVVYVVLSFLLAPSAVRSLTCW